MECIKGGWWWLPLTQPFYQNNWMPLSLSDYPTGIQEGDEKFLLVASHECELVR